MPGMTADVEIILVRKPDVLAVANAALRFTPEDLNNDKADPSTRAESSSLTSESHRARNGGSGGRIDLEERIRRYTERLNLSPSQVDQLRKKLRQIREKARAAFLSVDQSSPRAVTGLREKVRKESLAAILSILNADQQELFASMIAEKRPRQGTLWHLDDNGNLEPIRVTLGVSDATHSEISGDQVSEGMAVVTGME